MTDGTTDTARIVALTLRTTVTGGCHEALVPFDVPPGTRKVRVVVDPGDARLGLGLFDAAGPGYRSPGFRGVYGTERPECVVAADHATTGFLPGPIPEGRWHVLLPVFAATARTGVTIRVELTVGGAPAPVVDAPDPPGVVVDAPGWYRGDLHGHTTASSDAWSSGTALTPAGWADECRRLGLDFAAMTDHNVVAQNRDVAAASGDGVLLLAGEEVTSWWHGHATVSGLPVDAWLDWRHRPDRLPLGPHERRVVELVRAADELGAYLAAAHPFRDPLGWEFFADAESDPAAMPHGLEVWNGTFAPEDRAAVAYWDALLQRGWRLTASGGSDLHGTANDARGAGSPTTVVHADALSRHALIAALRAGRGFVMRHPAGVEVYLEADGRDGTVGLGGTAVGGLDDRLAVRATVRNGVGTELGVIAGGETVCHVPVTGDDETVHTDVPIRAGYVRAEVRRPPDGPGGPGVQETITNPIYLATSRSDDRRVPGAALSWSGASARA